MKTTPLVLSLVACFLLLSPMAHSATITVNTTDDENNTDGDCALREAVISANTDAAVDACTAGSGSDEITIPAGTYTLSVTGSGEDEAATGDLDITANLTLAGSGADTTIIDANGIDRVIDADIDFSTGAVTITGLKITGGSTTRNGESGGGIRTGDDDISLTNSTVSGNTAEDGVGGGISISTGDISLTNSTVSGNTAEDSGGGGISINTGDISLTNSTVSGNMGKRGGGGIESNGGEINLTNSTVSGNTVEDGSGGGISNNGGEISLTNSTVSGNTVDKFGGGIKNNGGEISLTNSTVSGNTADDFGGGISSNGGDISLTNTLIADNTPDDCGYGTITTLSYSIIEHTRGCTISSGTPITGDPSLEPLGNYGGSTETHRPGSKSIAIDAGNPAGCVDSDGAVLTTDQRGTVRPLDGNGDGTAVCDIGAFERAKFSVPGTGIKKLPSGLKKKP